MAKYVLADGDTAAAFLAGFNGNSDQAFAAQVAGGTTFRATKTLTSAAAATPVSILSASLVTGTQKAYITDVLLTVNGATAWTDSTGTIVTIQDTAVAPVVGITYAKAQLTGNCVLGKIATGVTLAAPVLLGTGFTAAKGLDIVADSDFDAGSDIVVTVCGFIA